RRAPELRPVMRSRPEPVPPALQEKDRAPDGGLAAGAFCCICSAICSKSGCGEMARRSVSSQGCLLPRDIIYDALCENQDCCVLSTITNTRQSADHAVAPNNKNASRVGRRRTQRCRAVPFVTASPG